MNLKPNQLINGQYAVIKLLHESRTLPSEVYLVQNIIDETLYTLKIIMKDTSLEKEVSEIFNREWKSLKNLNHENIVGYYDSGETETFYYILIDYVIRSETLEKFIEKNPNLTLTEKLKIFRDILFGIQHAHDKEIIHRDIAPNNILIAKSEDGLQVKIIDFGISKIKALIYEEQTTVNHYFNYIYSSPEQIAQRRVSSFSDIYSLGRVLFFLISGKNPDQNPEVFVSQIKNLEVDDTLQNIIRKATEYEVISRYVSVESFLSILDKEIDKLESRDSELIFKLTNTVINDLFRMNIIDFPREDDAKSFLSKNDLDFYIYRIKNEQYDIVCDLIKFRCTVEKSKGIIILIRADELDSYSAQEKIIARAFPIKTKISFGFHSVDNKDRMYLYRFLEKVDAEYRDFMNQKKNKQTEDRLISIWSKKIKQQENLLQRKKNIGYYKQIEYDVESGYYHFVIESIDNIDDLEIGKNIALLNKVTGKLEKVGEIKKYTDEVIFISPVNNFESEKYNQSGRFGIDYSESLKVTRRAKNALDTLKQGMAENKNLLDIIIDPSIGTMRTITKKVDFANEKIDPINDQAVISALGTQDIFLIQGPPGTGKSTVINELIYQIRQSEKDSKILLASQSHVAVDHIFNKLKKYFPEDLLVRIGNSERISKKSEANKIINQTKKWTTEIKQSSIQNMNNFIKDTKLRKILVNISEMDNGFVEEYEKIFKGNFSNDDKSFSKTLAQWYRGLDSLEGFDNLLLGKASIIASTCVGISSNKVMRHINFDWVIIDEAAKSTVPEVLIPMIKGKKIVLVGDHKQLPPIINEFDANIIKNTSSEKLSESLFEDLFLLAKDSDIAITLSKQFRMHPAISKMINKVFYLDDGVVITTDITPEERRLNYRIAKPVVWLSTERLQNNQQQNTTSKSFTNTCEANIILMELEHLEDSNSTNEKIKVGVISAYSGQKSLLEKLIKPSNTRWKNLEIVIENVDAFQGSEVDVVIYSVVRSNANKDIGFLSEQRRLNVALSRAKSQVIIVGNAHFMKEASKKEHNYFEDVLIYINRYKTDCELEVIQSGI
ncbi:serine/threonine-protein kinase [Listeria grayi]|uniref:serine/threonine-protein kinase n=1 Tax=Listeria grayi TaxID=1641 RepID=UPI001C896BB0|nr:serine/threonine-protein kinase [Listeria grayi]